MATEEQQKTLEKQVVVQDVQQPSVDLFSTPVSGVFISIVLFLIAITLLCFISIIHERALKILGFIVSVPLYKRATVFFIGLATTLATFYSPSNFYYIPITIGYISTFAFNEFASKKDIEKATAPLNEIILEKERSIEKLRIIIEEKKNSFYELVFPRIRDCLRVKGRNDSELLKKTKQKIEDLQDIILAQKIFMESPDEALRRFDNSTSDDSGLTSQIMVYSNQVIENPSN